MPSPHDDLALLLAPNVTLHGRFRIARDVAQAGGREVWPVIRDAILDGETPNDVACACFEAAFYLYRAGAIDDDEVRPIATLPPRRDGCCEYGAVKLLGTVPTGWAVAALDAYVALGYPSYQALRALTMHPHVFGLREVRRVAEDGEREPAVRRDAQRQFDERVGWVLQAALLEHPADLDRLALSVLVAMRDWTSLLVLLRAGRGDPFARRCILELPDSAVAGKGGRKMLRSIKSAAGSTPPAERGG